MTSSPTSMVSMAREIAFQNPDMDEMAAMEGAGNGSDAAQATKKKRVRNFTPDDRATHRVFEKMRREAFRDKLIELASLLPTLSDTDPNRLSKHMVVNASIDRHKRQIQLIEALQQERDELLAEVIQLRSTTGQVRNTISRRTSLISPDIQPLDTQQNLNVSLFVDSQTTTGPRVSQTAPVMPSLDGLNTAFDTQAVQLRPRGSGSAKDFPNQIPALLHGAALVQAHEPVLAMGSPPGFPESTGIQTRPQQFLNRAVPCQDTVGGPWEDGLTRRQEPWRGRPNLEQMPWRERPNLEQQQWPMEEIPRSSDALSWGMDLDISSDQTSPLLDPRFDATAASILSGPPPGDTTYLPYTNPPAGVSLFEESQSVPNQVVWSP